MKCDLFNSFRKIPFSILCREKSCTECLALSFHLARPTNLVVSYFKPLQLHKSRHRRLLDYQCSSELVALAGAKPQTVKNSQSGQMDENYFAMATRYISADGDTTFKCVHGDCSNSPSFSKQSSQHCSLRIRFLVMELRIREKQRRGRIQRGYFLLPFFPLCSPTTTRLKHTPSSRAVQAGGFRSERRTKKRFHSKSMMCGRR